MIFFTPYGMSYPQKEAAAFILYGGTVPQKKAAALNTMFTPRLYRQGLNNFTTFGKNSQYILPVLVIFHRQNADKQGVEELTIKDISEKLGILPVTVKKRLQKHGIKPIQYVGTAGIYDPSVLEIVKDSNPIGRPKKS